MEEDLFRKANIINYIANKSLDRLVEGARQKQYEPNNQFPSYNLFTVHDMVELFAKIRSSYVTVPSFLEIGTGEGVPSLAAALAGMKTGGIEQDRYLLRVAEENAIVGRVMGAVQQEQAPTYVKGDIFQLADYADLPTPFEKADVMYLYHSPSLFERFIPFFMENAKENAKLILLPALKPRRLEHYKEKYSNFELEEAFADKNVAVYHKTGNKI